MDERLRSLGWELPPPPQPMGAYVPAVLVGDLLFVSGMVPREEGRILFPGKLGAEVSLDQGARAARRCALLGLAAAREAVGSLDRIRRVVRVAGYVASKPDFTDQPKVLNGASDLLIELFGDLGRHARVALGVSSLPGNAPVEIEFLLQVTP